MQLLVACVPSMYTYKKHAPEIMLPVWEPHVIASSAAKPIKSDRSFMCPCSPRLHQANHSCMLSSLLVIRSMCQFKGIHMSTAVQVDACELARTSQSGVQHPLLDRVRQCSTNPDQAALFFQTILSPIPQVRVKALEELWCAATLSRMFSETGTNFEAGTAAAMAALQKRNQKRKRGLCAALCGCFSAPISQRQEDSSCPPPTRVLEAEAVTDDGTQPQTVASSVRSSHDGELETHGSRVGRRLNQLFKLQRAHLFSEVKGVLEPYDMLSKRKPTVLKPPDSVKGLAFPVLTLIEVSLGRVVEHEPGSNLAPQLKLDCDFLSQDTFPNLRGITCQFQNIPLFLRAVPPSCYVVYKTPALH